MRKYTLHILVLSASLLFWAACTNKKNTVVTRNYHNLTSRFNGLFNANEAYKEGVKKLEASAKEDYDHILHVFIYGNSTEAKSVYPEMEKCFKKASSVIERHSIRLKGHEYCKWIDETYLLIGKSHLYKHDYFPAIEAFTFVSSEFKKEPTRYDAKLWMIRTLNELGNISEAESMIDDIKGDKKFPKKKYAEEFAAIEADFYLRQKTNDAAIVYLKKALKESGSKKNKIRYSYILAQLYQDKGENKKAQTFYESVIKMHPSSYEMAFYAKLNLARVQEAGAKNSKSIKKELQKMAKDGKNEDYKDQIYYTLGQLEQKDGNTSAAVSYLKEAIKSSKTNTKQKGKSCLLLADIYYESTEYVPAQQYYDSAVTLLPKDFSGYYAIENKAKNLGKLVAYIDTVKTQDSLMRFSRLSDKEKEDVVQKEIKRRVADYYKQKELAKKAAEDAKQNADKPNSNLANTTPGGASAWYFYNPTTLNFGINEFGKKWGNRPLEDNWRRQNKQSTGGGDDNTVQENTPVLSEEDLDKAAIEKIKEPTQYFNKAPKNADELKACEKSVANSLYNLGVIYTQQLDNKEKGSDSFEDLLERFPNHPDKLTVYYQLYRNFIALENKTKAEKYKQLLIKDDPYSEFSQLITNPNFDASAESSKAKAEKLYEDTYDAFKEGEYKIVLIECQTARKLYPNSSLMPKFDYLRALAQGKTNGIPEMEKTLKEILLKYPSDPIRGEAQNLLTLIGQQKASNATADSTANLAKDSTTIAVKPEELFKLKNDTSHFYVLLYDKKVANTNTLSTRISAFNTKLYESAQLTGTSLLYDGNTFAVLVKIFPNKVKALDYYQVIKDNNEVFDSIEKGTCQQFIITQANFQVLMKNKKTKEYLDFFKANYLQ